MLKFFICFIAGIGAGLGTGFAGMSAAAVISPMLITFLGLPAYEAVGIALASDVLASAISAYTYIGGKLCRKPRSEYHDGQFLRIHDTDPRDQIYRKACYEDKRIHAGSQRKKAYHTVSCQRNSCRVYLWFCRCGRRNDDASALDQPVRV